MDARVVIETTKARTPAKAPLLPRAPLALGALTALAELACLALVHGPHRPLVAVISGQAPGHAGGLAGASNGLLGASATNTAWLVVAAEMASVLVLPTVILACVIACMLHVIANRPFQRREAGR